MAASVKPLVAADNLPRLPLRQKFEGLVKWKAGSVNWQGVVIGPQT